ncbi:MAG: ATP-binding protein, partial [Pseudomonas putida]
MFDLFPRRELAAEMARQLLKPSTLDIGLRSGLFFSGLRRTGKTTFLKNDLIPALEEMGALVIYVDLWSDTQTSPVALVLAAVRKA